MKNISRLTILCLIPLLALTLAACSTLSDQSSSGKTTLRVGLTPDLPPLAFVENGKLTGLEVDLARDLALALGRQVEVTSMPWADLLKSLQEDKIDVIMGGLTITKARSLPVLFTDPIMESGLMALVRVSDRETLSTPEALANYGGQIGVMPGTTSDAFVQRNYPKARRIPVSSASDAALVLQRRGMDAFVHDLPAVIWLHSLNAANTAVIKEPLQSEQIGWALRRDDNELKDSINGVLVGWQKDGSLRATIDRWLPYYQKLLDTKP